MKNTKKISLLARQMNVDAILLTSDENCHYVVGFGPSEGVVLVTKSNYAYHFVDSRYIEVAQKYAQSTAVKTVLVEKTFVDSILKVIKAHHIKTLGYEDSDLTVAKYNVYKQKLGCEFVAVENRLTDLRNVKQPYEIEYMKQAQQIAQKAFTEILNDIKAGVSEKYLASRLDYYMAIAGSEKPSFDTILISGTNTSMPHGVPSEKTICDGDFITMDFGAVVGGYHSDMTRTVALSHATDEMKKVYDTVLNAQTQSLKQAKAGVKCSDLYNVAYGIIDMAGYGENFKHALGHGVGLLIHEGHSLSPKNNNILEKGNVVTIEPGIYLPGKFGVRIEDTVCITQSGVDNLVTLDKQLIII